MKKVAYLDCNHCSYFKTKLNESFELISLKKLIFAKLATKNLISEANFRNIMNIFKKETKAVIQNYQCSKLFNEKTKGLKIRRSSLQVNSRLYDDVEENPVL